MSKPQLPDELPIDPDLMAQVEILTDTVNAIIRYLRSLQNEH